MIKAIIFDFFSVLEQDGRPNEVLLTYIRSKLKSNYKLGILSNTAADWIREILSKEDIAMFDDIVLSYQTKYAKPEPQIYSLALQNLAVKAEESVFVDNIEDFCIAARSVGMKAVRYDNFEQMEKQLEAILAGSNN